MIVSGRVQGVGFRFYTHSVAQSLGVSGWTRNLPSGQVEILARIPDGKKNQFIELIRQGPPASSVSGLEVKIADETPDCPLRGFSIKR